MATKQQSNKKTSAAAPGTKGDEAAAAEKKGKIFHPALKADAEGKPTVKLEEVPADYDPKKHKPLKKSDFASEATYCIMRAEELERKAADYRQEADLIKKGGGKKAAQKAKRLAKMQERMEALKKELAESGINVEELMSSLDEE